MSGATKSPGTGAFAIEKVVVFGAVILGAGFSAIHATGWVLAAVTGNPPPAFSIPHVLAAIRLRPYVPGVAPGFHAVLLLLLVVAAAWSARRVLRWRSSRAAAPSHRASGFDTRPLVVATELGRRRVTQLGHPRDRRVVHRPRGQELGERRRDRGRRAEVGLASAEVEHRLALRPQLARTGGDRQSGRRAQHAGASVGG